eukprot:CAMPEP_0176400028 /NCGR_PEP_ID=MMETSP0126-20121128/47240_1 /TAXON_ID=141414 ORGANISM="Strombidinopsis acuminatum, Strain SPMC142" /NCGR_SAMPLE_ID=MMETSP0126 /ASSEMBLY_ACC=CAM_ASM_000229 /LENGTH=52 /DNA_ID=CAMNT_0017775979 /DNA_START=404 /DNA_END=562 /DNA_ORIENTATION=-
MTQANNTSTFTNEMDSSMMNGGNTGNQFFGKNSFFQNAGSLKLEQNEGYQQF